MLQVEIQLKLKMFLTYLCAVNKMSTYPCTQQDVRTNGYAVCPPLPSAWERFCQFPMSKALVSCS